MSPPIKIDFSEKPMLVVVGPHAENFHVHVNILTRTSAFLKVRCDRRLEDGSRFPAIGLPDHDADLFGVYVQWLYGDDNALSVDNEILVRQIVLARCYIMGEQLDDRKFRDFVTSRIIRETGGEDLCMIAVNILYEGTDRHSPSRRLMVDLYELFGRGECLRGYHPQFQADVNKARVKRHNSRFRKLAHRKISKGSSKMHRVMKPMGAPPRKHAPREVTPCPKSPTTYSRAVTPGDGSEIDQGGFDGRYAWRAGSTSPIWYSPTSPVYSGQGRFRIGN